MIAIAGDAADPQTADRVGGAAVDHFGRIDTLANNAGIFIPKAFVEYTSADFAAVLSVNLAGFFSVHTPETHAFLASLSPMNRMGEIQDVVDAVLYLETATFVSGEILHVDGGAHAGRW